ncbi:hypothetical protein [Gordonia neofelifaecis]|uniref:hypothetical protein n=1 Tax=Gordonia neofelifaecis TaxID=945692 RepID=UPI00158543C7|nr:hypothetical protein [Gordonia neofelifaecis]
MSVPVRFSDGVLVGGVVSVELVDGGFLGLVVSPGGLVPGPVGVADVEVSAGDDVEASAGACVLVAGASPAGVSANAMAGVSARQMAVVARIAEIPRRLVFMVFSYGEWGRVGGQTGTAKTTTLSR